MRVEIVSEEDQREPAAAIAAGVRGAARVLGLPRATVTVKLTDPEEMRRLNRTWRGRDLPTDVLSFPAHGPAGYLGDLAICPAEAARRAGRGRRPATRDLEALAIHGLLHLLGFDHERDDGEMERAEREIGRRLRARRRRR
ncbi:MAG: rRNA maturation RNase YbeY [Acidobacteria bacterium]|nr:MAG: rRNA maturation RNase YbeY [Acidobacteriota bacterium]